jgi:hypothetical protein
LQGLLAATCVGAGATAASTTGASVAEGAAVSAVVALGAGSSVFYFCALHARPARPTNITAQPRDSLSMMEDRMVDHDSTIPSHTTTTAT